MARSGWSRDRGARGRRGRAEPSRAGRPPSRGGRPPLLGPPPLQAAAAAPRPPPRPSPRRISVEHTRQGDCELGHLFLRLGSAAFLPRRAPPWRRGGLEFGGAEARWTLPGRNRLHAGHGGAAAASFAELLEPARGGGLLPHAPAPARGPHRPTPVRWPRLPPARAQAGRGGGG